MDTTKILLIAQVVICVLLILSILLQNRAEGLGKMFGGGGEVYRTRRGFEKFLSVSSIVLIVLLAALSLIILEYAS